MRWDRGGGPGSWTNIQLLGSYLQPTERDPQDTLWLTLYNVSKRQGNVFINAGCQCPGVCVYSTSPEAASLLDLFASCILLHHSCLGKLT